ncbi:MAG: NAD(P)H-dependent oxidoreductase subunit E [Clostridia bacterium]|jgi:NADH-quinone oxidoreductase subunit E|nr:NAD(P)H-dependent oxidoreductase subunit E [Clostridia bacterium]
MENKIDFTVLDQAISEFGTEKKALIAILQRAQEVYRYLPAEIFPYIAEKLDIPEAGIYGVATFYENFSLEKKGKYVIKICDGTACHVRKSTAILDAMRKELGLSESKKTTDDFIFTVETVSCLGACSSAPAIMVNDEIYPTMTPDSAVELLKSIKEKENV